MPQTEIDFGRAEQLAILRDATIPNLRSRGLDAVSAKTLKALLRLLDDYARHDGECFASEATLAQKLECSRRTIIRSLKALEALSLITKERRFNSTVRTTINHIRIVWTELSLLRSPTNVTISRPNDTTNVTPCGTNATPCPDQCDILTHKGAMESKPKAQGRVPDFDQRDYETVVERGRELFARLRPMKFGDRQLVARICFAATTLSEHWLQDVVGGVSTSHHRPFARLTVIAREAAERLHGESFDEHIVNDIPKEFYDAITHTRRTTLMPIATLKRPPSNQEKSSWELMQELNGATK